MSEESLMLASELDRLNFLNMIHDNVYNLTRIRNGKPAARIFKAPRIRSFVVSGILTTAGDRRYYKLTRKARDELDYIRLKLIQGKRK